MRAGLKVFIGRLKKAVIISESEYFYVICKNPEILGYVNTLLMIV